MDTLPNLHTIFDESDLTNIRIKYLGGLHVLILPNTDTTLQSITSNSSLSNYFKTIRPWNNKFHVPSRLTWLSIEGLPPQAWHEAAFTRIARIWGEVILPEKCNENNNNLVAGKVCILTKCMLHIQHNIPVLIDEIHVYVRVREILGECDEIFTAEKTTSESVFDKDHFGDNDDEADNENQLDKDHGEDMEDEDDIFDDGSECDIFLQQDFDNYQGEGGWIRDEVSGKDPGEHHDKDSPKKGMVDDISEYLNTPVDLECHVNLPASPNKDNWVCQSLT
ncbi:RNA-directed DNA polymerase, eukaryota [Tanacetum coccineum]